ncbi:MAG: VCBS repeat-containing protein, partial [Firmicutes bacterium]|nr:VCBS repeat-containing protein [Bacillota bacterium]
EIVWEPDAYENAYDSGTHFIDAGTGRFLEFNSSGNGSYFTPNPWDMSADFTVDVTVLPSAPDGAVRLAFRTDDGAITVSRVLGFEDGNCVLSTPEALDPDASDAKEATDAFLIMDLVQKDANHFLFTQFETPGAGEWVRETSCDLDGDGLPDTSVIGNADGYLGLYTQYLERPVDSVTKWRLDGYLESPFGNAYGNNHLKFGQYACPAFADLNGDGIPDLIVGHREYGIAYPVDSPYFPEAGELTAQLGELKSRGYYVGAHFKTTVAATAEQERTELELHKNAFAAYDLETEGIGVNHHTWVSSNVSLRQSFDSEWDAGFLWNSGWKAANNTVSPENNAENVWSIPFFAVNGEGEETILLWNTSTVGYDGNGWSSYVAKYDLPVSVYYHCDLAYLDPEGTETFVRNIGAFADRNGYRWVSEDTLAKEIAAAYNTTVAAAYFIDRPTEILTLSSGNPSDTKAEAEKHKNEWSLTFRLGEKGTDKPLYDAELQSRASVRVVPCELFDMTPVRVTSALPGEVTSLRATFTLADPNE